MYTYTVEIQFLNTSQPFFLTFLRFYIFRIRGREKLASEWLIWPLSSSNNSLILSAEFFYIVFSILLYSLKMKKMIYSVYAIVNK